MRYFQAGDTPPEKRVKLLKLIWDLVGTEFGGRQLQYEHVLLSRPARRGHATVPLV